jgi:putative two-component system response regulator
MHLELMSTILEMEGYKVISTNDTRKVLDLASANSPDLAILDVMMPGMNGYELCKRLKDAFNKKFFPIILVTGLHQLEDKLTGLEAGADDFFSKPFNPKEIIAKIRSLIRLKRLQDELDHSEDIIFTLAIAIEAKDPYTKGHSERVSRISEEMAKAAGLPEKEALNIKKGGILHDIGKIGLRENILHKKEALSSEELETIRRHPATGVEICRPLYSLRQILPAIMSHHERWDGKGFPDGLSGEDIPLSGRIISVADSFDAMVSIRPYRASFSIQEAIRVMKAEEGLGQWDRWLLNKFFEIAEGQREFIERLYTNGIEA